MMTTNYDDGLIDWSFFRRGGPSEGKKKSEKYTYYRYGFIFFFLHHKTNNHDGFISFFYLSNRKPNGKA